MDCRDSALFSGVDEASCENMLRCFSAYEQRFTSGQTILTCGQQQDMIGVLLSAVLLGETNVVSPMVAVAALALVSVGIIIVTRPEAAAGSARREA